MKPEPDRAGDRSVAVYIITFRRPQLLRRALSSVLMQTHRNLRVVVINDDPEDTEVADIIRAAGDARVSLHQPVERRGGTRNFNIAFGERDADFVALLEDDNWWEPTFIERQLEVLHAHPESPLVIGNERIWDELEDGQWRDTGKKVWPFDDVRFVELNVEKACGSAWLCNSSIVVRTGQFSNLLTPDSIPVDVTEHFRERLLTRRLLLNGETLVNFAHTRETARSTDGTWGDYQCLLIGSMFVAAETETARKTLARKLWLDCVSKAEPRAVALVSTGVAFREARELLINAPLISLGRFILWLVHNPSRLGRLLRARRELSAELEFLIQAPLTRQFANGES